MIKSLLASILEGKWSACGENASTTNALMVLKNATDREDPLPR